MTEVLVKMTELIHKIDPMKLDSPEINEYEAEALSILSRFTEMGATTGLLNSAIEVVKAVFVFWFGEKLCTNFQNWEQLTLELMNVYFLSYPSEE